MRKRKPIRCAICGEVLQDMTTTNRTKFFAREPKNLICSMCDYQYEMAYEKAKRAHDDKEMSRINEAVADVLLERYDKEGK